MSGGACIVAVDVGNTAVKLAVRRGDAIVDHAIGITSQGWAESAMSWVQQRLGCDVAQWRLASVHEAAAEQLISAIVASDSDSEIRIISRREVPIQVDVQHPDRLGIDRLLGAYAARNRSAKPSIVIDAGSAITIDWVAADGRFCGGAIMPGLDLQSRALATGTEALPQVDWGSQRPLQLPAKNTFDAIRGGILFGTAAAIDSLIDSYRELAGISRSDDTDVFLTGGDSSVISPHLRNTHESVRNLVCRGLLDLPCSAENRSNTCQEG